MLFNSFLILFLTKIVCFVDSRNYTGHAVYKIYAKDLIKSHTSSHLDEDTAILLANGSIPLPSGTNKLWQGIERNGDEYAVVHVEPSKKRRFKRDLNYHLLTDDLNNWITGNHYRDTNQPIIVPLENFPLLKVQPYNDPKGYLSASSKLEPASESKLFPSYLAPNYDGSFWTLLLQSPLRTLAQLTSWNNPFAGNSWGFMPALTPTTSPLLANQPPASTAVGFESAHSTPVHSGSHTSPNGQASQMNNQMNNQQTANYKAAASTNTVKHASAQEEAPVYLSAFVANFRLDAYHNLDDIYEYLDRLAAIHKHIRVFTIGYSHENRPIKAIEIHQDTANLNKKMVYLDGLIHAREHITTAALLNIIEQILIRKIDCNFLIVPVINVDGYVYTWTTDRLWRKNRRKTTPNNSFLHSLRTRFASERCNGVDLNRNFDINFGGVGSSLNPCSELYAGPNAFSEPETSALARLLWDNRQRIRLFISLHSFGQLWAAPHSYTRARSPHHDLHMSLLKEVQQAVYSVNNVLYNVGPLGSSLYLGSGYSLDYCYQKLDIVHAYLVEVRDKGEFGFLLPADQILPTSFEILEGILVSIKRAY